MMKKEILVACVGLIISHQGTKCFSQENMLTHYFASSSNYNPAFAGDTRLAQVQLVNRIQPTVARLTIYNTSFSYDQKIPNQHSGINANINQKLSVFREIQIKLSYSYTAIISRKSAIKGGVGISWNSVNTYANTYKFPDQYDINGYNGLPTMEPSIIEKASYPAFTGGIVLYSNVMWISVGADNLNRPVHQFAGEKVHVPTSIAVSGGYLVPIDKNKRSKRIFSNNGGWIPYSSIGPVFGYYSEEPFHEAYMGVNAFTKPVFWGGGYRLNAFQGQGLDNKTNTLNFMAGFRNEILSIAYSYDFVINHTPTNYKGAHEVSLIYYFYTIKEDYKKNPLIPFPNQLMY
jgi:type IX secretion system PorP/SprF family membrane protein